MGKNSTSRHAETAINATTITVASHACFYGEHYRANPKERRRIEFADLADISVLEVTMLIAVVRSTMIELFGTAAFGSRAPQERHNGDPIWVLNHQGNIVFVTCQFGCTRYEILEQQCDNGKDFPTWWLGFCREFLAAIRQTEGGKKHFELLMRELAPEEKEPRILAVA